MSTGALQTSPQLDDLVTRLVRAHPSSAGLRALLELRADEPFAAQRLAEVISQDRRSGERIRIAYSRLVAHDWQRPLTPRDAIALSGYRPIHCSAVATTIVDLVRGARLGREYVPFWSWSFTVASFATVIAETRLTQQDCAFAGAFLREVARLLMHLECPAETAQARALASAAGTPLQTAEREVLGFSHLELGSALAEAWELPPCLQLAFDEHDAERRSLPGMIRRARAAAAHYGYTDPLDVPPPPEEVAAGDHIVDEYFRLNGGPDFWQKPVQAFVTSSGIEGR